MECFEGRNTRKGRKIGKEENRKASGTGWQNLNDVGKIREN